MSSIIKYLKKLKASSPYAIWLFQYTKPYLPALSLTMLFSIAASLISVGTAVVSQQLIDNASIGKTITSNILLYILCILIMQIVQIVSSMFTIIIQEKFAFGIRKQVYEKILHSCYHDVSKYHSGDLMTRLTSDTGNVADGIANVIPRIIILVVEFLASFIVLLCYDPMLAVFALILAPIGGILSFWFGRKLKYLQSRVQESESNYRSFITESLSNILIIKSFRTESFSAERLQQLRDERMHWVIKKQRMSLISSTGMSLAFQAGYVLALAWGAAKLSTKAITYGTMSVFLTLVNRLQSPILGLAYTIPQVVNVLASAGRVMELQNLPVENVIEETITPENVGVKVEHLSFGYSDDVLFEDASVDINPGEFVAIVGASGIGKTTLIRLILSFMNANAGKIQFFNDKNEQVETNANSREFMSYVPQGNTLFSGTIEYNIRMGKKDATDEEIYEALHAASAFEFVSELPQGIHTVIGERGYGISEGQAQRIAIARALIKKAPFLILDEATSSLDEKTELAVLEGIKHFSYHPTCLLITHRRSVLAYCDREIVIDDKKITEKNI